jgi:type II secretory ATPase GspE/PulE/Tfp pilus assembly ATPase PilB-like protein
MKGPYLQIQSGNGQTDVALDRPRLSIGRHAANEVVVTDTRASRSHCVIEQIDGGEFQIRDLGSANGTILNGQIIKEAVLTPGDVIAIGDTRLTYLVNDEQDPEWLTEDDIIYDEPVPVENEFGEHGGTIQMAPSGDYEQDLERLAEALPDRSYTERDIELASARGLIMHGAERKTKSGQRREPVDVFRLLLLVCFRSRATDIHIEPWGNISSIRLRIDGSMVDVGKLPGPFAVKMITLVKVLCDIDIAHRNVIQEGRFSSRVPGMAPGVQRTIDFRVSFAPSVHGQKLVVRILDAFSGPIRASDLNLPAQMLGDVAGAIRQDSGMVLVCGPTGSGKTTTLYSLIRSIDVQRRNVVTIEDPVEIQVPGITQIPVREDQEASFPQLLRSVLRQDPDVILVGEMRDAETARVGMQAAVTGHLVFSTVHTKDTVGCIFRLLDLGVEAYLVAQGLHLVLAQRLARQLCPYCKRPYALSDDQRREMGAAAEGVLKTYQPVGCARCLGTGFAGRRAFFELLRVNDELRNIIAKVPNIGEVQSVLTKGTFQSLRDSGYQLVAEGVCSFTEIERTVGRGDHG